MIKATNLIQTGIAWIPEIPSDWELKRIKLLFDFNRNIVGKTSSDYDVLSLTTKGVIKRDLESGMGKFPASFDGYQIVKPNSIMLCLFDMDVTPRVVGHVDDDGIISAAYTNIIPKKGINSKYYYYYFLLQDKNKSLLALGTGIRITLNKDFFGTLKIPVPPIEVQNGIVAYLDKKNNEIDKFIRNKERLVELLDEQKQSVIRKAVTKGLSSKTNYTETRIDWVGEIPENWNIKKLKYCTKIIYGISPHENTYNDKGIGSVLVNGPVEYSDENFGYTRELKWTTDPKKFAPQDALLFCLRGSTTGRLNICHTDVSIGRGVAAIISKTNQDFMVYAIKALVDFISDSFKGSTFPSVTSEDLNNYLIPLPASKEEEIEIVNFLNEETKIFELAISKARQEISSIKEYREALITDLVTGKRSIPQPQKR
jgi:type I restriction enzyme S subunit